jgi:hypothetical protein
MFAQSYHSMLGLPKHGIPGLNKVGLVRHVFAKVEFPYFDRGESRMQVLPKLGIPYLSKGGSPSFLNKDRVSIFAQSCHCRYQSWSFPCLLKGGIPYLRKGGIGCQVWTMLEFQICTMLELSYLNKHVSVPSLSNHGTAY